MDCHSFESNHEFRLGTVKQIEEAICARHVTRNGLNALVLVGVIY